MTSVDEITLHLFIFKSFIISGAGQSMALAGLASISGSLECLICCIFQTYIA